jgi:hypothetical protein
VDRVLYNSIFVR